NVPSQFRATQIDCNIRPRERSQLYGGCALRTNQNLFVLANDVEFDLHGFHPNSIGSGIISNIVRQAWEMGAPTVTIIHGHGWSRGKPRPFANTNTCWLGMTIRSILRNDRDLRVWMYAKFDSSHPGSTTVRLRPNANPNRSSFDGSFLPERDFSQ